MSSCSLAEDLVAADAETEEGEQQEGHGHVSGKVRAVTADTVRGSGEQSASSETAAAAVPDDERLLLAGNDPLCIYLQRHRCFSPDFTLPSTPAASRTHIDGAADGGALDEKEEEPMGSADETEASGILLPSEQSPYELYAASALSPRQLLLWLCTLLLPCSLLLVSPCGLHPTVSLWAASLTRSQWRWLCKRLETVGVSRAAALPALSPLHRTFGLLRLSLMLAAAWLVCAAVLLIAAVSRSLLLLSSLTAAALLCSLLPAAVLVLLVVNCWAAVEHLRLASAFHTSFVALLPLPAVFAASSQLILQCLQRVTEAETVSRGYYLSASAVSAMVAMDSRQEATGRQAAAVRRTASAVMQQMLAALETAQTQLLCPREVAAGDAGAARTLKPTLTVEDSCVAPSIAELKLLRCQLQASQSAFLALLTADRQQDDGLIPSALLARLVSRLTRGNHALRSCLTLHSRVSAATPVPESAFSSSPSASSPLSVVHHRLRSARARLLLLCQRRSPTDSQLALSDLRYLRAALQEADRTCGDMQAEEQQRTAVLQQQPAEALQEMREQPWRDEEKEEDEAETQRGSSGAGGALLGELEALRRRRGAAAALAEGCGAVFEGDGQRREQRDGDGDDEEDDSAEAGERRRRRLQQRPKAAALLSGPPSLSLSLSMVGELKSVLSHRPAVAFRCIDSGSGER